MSVTVYCGVNPGFVLMALSSWYTTEKTWLLPSARCTVLPAAGEAAPSKKLSSLQPVAGLIGSLAWAGLWNAPRPTTVVAVRLIATSQPARRREA